MQQRCLHMSKQIKKKQNKKLDASDPETREIRDRFSYQDNANKKYWANKLPARQVSEIYTQVDTLYTSWKNQDKRSN